MKKVDDRKLDNTVYELIRRIRHRIRECEKHNIDYDAYVDKDNLYHVLQMLDCCLDHKDSKYISRREWNR